MRRVADGTPPERQILFRLTPLATAESLSASNLLFPVSAALDLIKQRQRYKSSDSRKLIVKPTHYTRLLTELEELPELKSFVDDKIRVLKLKDAVYRSRSPEFFTESDELFSYSGMYQKWNMIEPLL
ncbi:uncharacterized protein RSE6_14025 [Rhynchosporium secalis]|uniref:Uncharacterized protein n=1 Tax=Rhynchosporium secalis TaxID=38038 RepID=A0A1E1MUD7_RHYSE|nr:uncharacterized protein RSE6_14025 [Rhynchosporium secalis]